MQNRKRKRVRTGKLLRIRIIEDLSEIKKIKVTKNKEEIEEFSENLRKIIELDEKEIRYETRNKNSKNRTKNIKKCC